MNSGSSDLRVDREGLSLREMTARKLREAIVALRFKPGERLVERVLCEQTGVSRSCLREALRHLESEGLIDRRGGRGLFVASITAEEARQIYEVRAALEPEIGQLFAKRATEDQIEELCTPLADLEKAITTHDLQRYVTSLDSFYEVLCKGSGNAVAHRILRMLHARISYLRTITTARATRERERETVRLLQEISAAARRQEPAEVAQRCRAFVERSAAFALQVLTEQSAPEDATR